MKRRKKLDPKFARSVIAPQKERNRPDMQTNYAAVGLRRSHVCFYLKMAHSIISRKSFMALQRVGKRAPCLLTRRIATITKATKLFTYTTLAISRAWRTLPVARCF
jgi:hypothetical protein